VFSQTKRRPFIINDIRSFIQTTMAKMSSPKRTYTRTQFRKCTKIEVCVPTQSSSKHCKWPPASPLDGRVILERLEHVQDHEAILDEYFPTLELYIRTASISNQVLVRYAMSRCLVRSGRLEEAVLQLSILLVEDRSFIGAHRLKGGCLFSQKKFEAAVHSYDNALLLMANSMAVATGDFVHVHFNRARCLRALHQLSNAVEGFESALKYDQGNLDSLFFKSLCLMDLRRFDEALSGLDLCLKASHSRSDLSQKNVAMIHSKRGKCLFESERLEEALHAFISSSNLNSLDECAFSSQGICLNKLGRSLEALKAFKVACFINPTASSAVFEQTYSGMARSLHELGRKEEEVECYDAAIEIALKAGHLEDAVFNWLYNKGMTLIEMKLNKEAVKAFQEASKYRNNRNCHMSFYRLGVLLKSLDMHDEALTAFMDCIEAKPDFSPVYSQLAHLLWLKEDYPNALALCNKGLAVHPQNKSLLANKCTILEKLSCIDEAIITYQHLLQLDPENAQAKNRLQFLQINARKDCVRSIILRRSANERS
jgi:tetratricopeptide (TPR) repeat protein